MAMAPARSPSTNATPEEILRALADPERLAVAGTLARAPATATELASALGLTPERVRRHLNRLATVAVVRGEEDRRTFRLVPETLRAAALEVGPPREPGVALGAVFEEEEVVLRNYFRGGRLREIPARQNKKRIVLARLALEFEPGVHYQEGEVNRILTTFHDDYASLRRHLVDEGFLDRESGEYWRSGGPVEV